MKIETNEFRVKPQPLPNVREAANYSPDQFGAELAGSGMGTAKVLGIAAGAFKEQEDRNKKMKQDLELSALRRQYQEEVTRYNYGENGVMNAELINAKGMPDRVNTGMSEIRAKYAAMTKDPEVRQAFESGAMDLESKFIGNAHIKETEQLTLARRTDDKVTLASNADSITIAARSGHNDAIPDLLNSGSSFLEGMAKERGWTQAMLAHEKKIYVGQVADGAISNLVGNGEIDKAKALYSQVAPMIGTEYMTKWDSQFKVADERAAIAAQKAAEKAQKDAEDQFWNDFLLLDPKVPAQAAKREEMMNGVRASGNGVLYDKMKKRNLDDRDETKQSDLSAYETLDLMARKGQLTSSMVNEAYNTGLLSHSDAKGFMGAVNGTKEKGWDKTDELQMEMATNYVKVNIKDPHEQNQALTLIRMGNYKGPEIYSYAKNIVDNNLYKTGKNWGIGAEKGYTATESQMVEKSTYWKKYGDVVVNDLDGLTQNWNTTKQILDLSGTKPNDPVMIEVVRQLKEMGSVAKDLTVDEIVKMVKDARYEYYRNVDDKFTIYMPQKK